VPSLAGARGFLARHRDLGVRFGADALLQSGVVQVATLCLGAIVGTAAVGALRGGQTLFGPFWVAYIGLMSAAIPEGSRLLARRPQSLEPALRAFSAALAGLALACGATLAAIPDRWGTALLGDTWPGAHALVPALTVLTFASAVSAGALVGLRVQSAAREGLRLRLVTGPVLLGAAAVGGALGGVEAGVWGLAAAQCLTASGAWWLFGNRTGVHLATA